jgi:hypothetical protein
MFLLPQRCIGNILWRKVTDEDREIPSVGTGSFLLDCPRDLFAQSSSLILCARPRILNAAERVALRTSFKTYFWKMVVEGIHTNCVQSFIG